MNSTKLNLVAIAAILIAACSSHKKNTSAASAQPATVSAPTNTPTTAVGPSTPTKPANGIHPPGDAELSAIKPQFSDVTLDQLNTGYTVYTTGACLNCHGTKSIYKRDVSQWKGIIDDMAEKARISDAQKDAVYKYVLAIKATQPK